MNKEGGKKICSVGVDVDTLEDYARSYSYKISLKVERNYIYTLAIPRLLNLFSTFGVKATFFIVGRDIENPANIPILKEIIREGHEIGNHTMNHIYPFSRLDRTRKRQEILLMHQLAVDRLGYKIKGFRAPGYGIDTETLQILREEGYIYDSSVHPTYLMLPVNLCVLFNSSFRKLPEMKNCLHFLAPLVPYRPKANMFFLKGNYTSGIAEIPITVTPFTRMPFYGTFHLLSGKWIFDLSYFILQKMRMHINYGVHAIEMLDFMESGRDNRFHRQPGFRIPWVKKKKNYQYILGRFKKHFDFKPIINLAETVS